MITIYPIRFATWHDKCLKLEFIVFENSNIFLEIMQCTETLHANSYFNNSPHEQRKDNCHETPQTGTVFQGYSKTIHRRHHLYQP